MTFSQIWFKAASPTLENSRLCALVGLGAYRGPCRNYVRRADWARNGRPS